MKLAPLLAQYLYNHKKLELVGLGTFSLDPSARIDPDTKHLSEGISFQPSNTIKEDEQLIAYISSQTGKMKALASSDLSSYLDLAKEFLNIGKPFQLEGIGTLVKKKSGDLDFTADHLLTDKVKETGIKELTTTSTSDESFTTYENLKPKTEKSSARKKIVVIGLTIVTAALIIWAGYRVYKNNSSSDNIEPPVTEQATTSVPVPDTTLEVSKKPLTVNAGVPEGNYRFVIEVAKQRRALYRYDMLRKSNVPVQISTTDSVNYKLFFVLKAAPADTSHIKDSLTTFYPAINGRKTFIDQ